MLQIRRIEPFYTKRVGDQLKLVFAYQYFSVLKDDELFNFIPVEGKEIIINLKNLQIENLSDVFVFQRGSRFIRLPLYQLLLVSNIHDHLQKILANMQIEVLQNKPGVEIRSEHADLLDELEELNRQHLIDVALETRNEQLFNDLMN
ncbi:hypothetical protein [Kurthia senegalensis]|uniref:hypothetical protein n=1 Tax=Kurthia senegalensis TaxID=1033740 RepID=UPI000289FA9D|nr:hypothetical protein [Kurthia senegalensis]